MRTLTVSCIWDIIGTIEAHCQEVLFMCLFYDGESINK